MAPDPRVVRETLILAARLEHEQSRRRLPQPDERFLPWMPYQIPGFLALLAEAVPAAPGSRLLGVGAGIGTKEWLAREIFGLGVSGIEISPELAAQAAGLGLDVACGDALDYAGYGDHDLIWLYRPCRDPDTEAALEKTIWDAMAPGTLILGAALENPPPEARFFPVLENVGDPAGIWQKLPSR